MQQLNMKDTILLTMDIRDVINDRVDAATVMLFDRFRQQMKAGAVIETIEVDDLAMEADGGRVLTQYNLRIFVNSQLYLITLTLWDEQKFAFHLMRYGICIDSKRAIDNQIREIAAAHA